jgi:uncharacterized protein YecE (DUF72 family)
MNIRFQVTIDIYFVNPAQISLYNIVVDIYLGCPIWSFKDWVGNFYPKGTKPADFLCEYARRLTTIEGNTTFYAIPAPKTIESWIEHTRKTAR